MLALFLYLGFILWFLAGIGVGILVERKRNVKRKIQERLHKFPKEVKVVGNIHDEVYEHLSWDDILTKQ